MSSSDYQTWAPPKKAIINSLDEIDPKVLSEWREFLEQVDPLRLKAERILGIEEYITEKELLDAITADLSYAKYLDVNTSSVQISNSTTLTEFYGPTIAGNAMGANGAIKVEIGARYLQNSGGGATIRFQISFGGTTMWDATSFSLSSNAATHVVHFTFLIANTGVTNDQELAGNIVVGGNATPTTGFGGIDINGFPIPFAGSSAVDTTTDKALSVKVQHSVADAQIAFEKTMAYTLKVAT